jgi:hypothetical protein
LQRSSRVFVARRSKAMLHRPYIIGAVFLLLLLGGPLIPRDADSRGPPDQLSWCGNDLGPGTTL